MQPSLVGNAGAHERGDQLAAAPVANMASVIGSGPGQTGQTGSAAG